MTPPIPYILQVAAEQSISNDETASSDWTNPKGQTKATMRDLLFEGVRSFELDVHYVAELDQGPGVTSDGFRVCKSVTSEVAVDPLCSGSRNTELDIDLDEDTCRSEGVYPEFGIHAGCRPESPHLEDVLNAFDLFVGDGNPAAVILRFKDFTTGDFVDSSIELLVQSELEKVIEIALARILYTPEEGVDYSDIDNWPSWEYLIEEKNRRMIIFSNSTETSPVFDDSLLRERNFDGSTRRSAEKRQSQNFFGYTIDSSDRIVIQGEIITSSGNHIETDDVSGIVVGDERIPSIQRLVNDHFDGYVWGFVEPFSFSDDSECVMIDPSNGFGWYRTNCNENYAVACASPNSPNSFTFGQVTDNDYRNSDVDSFCSSPTVHTAPTSPFSHQQLVDDANNRGVTEPIYVNLRFTTVVQNRVVCGCEDGCWYLPGNEIRRLPLTSFCVTPSIEIPNDSDPIVLPGDDDDDDLTNGQIVGISFGAFLIVLLLLLILLLLFCFGRGTRFNEVSGRVGVMVEEEEEDEKYKQSRGPLTTADTTAATKIEYPDHKMDMDAQVDMGLEEEDKGPANKRKIGALEVSSGSMRDYRSGIEPK